MDIIKEKTKRYIMKGIFGERVSALLKERKMTQAALAKNIGISDVSLSKYINGVYTPKTAVVEAAADALGVDPGFLLGFKERDYGNEIEEIKGLIKKNAAYMGMEEKAEIIILLLSDGKGFEKG